MAEVTQSVLQMRGTSSRWLLKALPWVDVKSGIYQINRTEEASFKFLANHTEDDTLPKTSAKRHEFDFDQDQIELDGVQAILQLHSRVADLYNKPFEQVGQQIRLTVEGLRETQEYEMVNNPKFGLLASAVDSQRIESVRPTPDALDNLISLRRNTQFLFAHPQTVVAFGHECNKQGLNIQNIPFQDNLVPSWRGIPLLSCNKSPVTKEGGSSIIAVRTGKDNQGVIGLRPRVLLDQFEPGVNIRFMNINEQTIISYLVSAYFSVAVLIPSALGVLSVNNVVEAGNHG
jgi:hypothetical protein